METTIETTIVTVLAGKRLTHYTSVLYKIRIFAISGNRGANLCLNVDQDICNQFEMEIVA